MKNMDVNRLILVHPLCDHLSRDARNYSVHAQDILESAIIVENLQEALSGCDLSAAMTRRSGQWRKKDFWLEDLALFLTGYDDKTVSLVFGREQSGLTNDEIRACDVQCAIPSSRQFPSLNLRTGGHGDTVRNIQDTHQGKLSGEGCRQPRRFRRDDREDIFLFRVAGLLQEFPKGPPRVLHQ
jgi:tRNA(Leu) C34 or U34 (ribose-2'-O)-methylase TrmL